VVRTAELKEATSGIINLGLTLKRRSKDASDDEEQF